MRNQVSALAAAGLVVATLAATAALALPSDNEQQERDTLPVGQFVEVPTSTAPTTGSAVPQAVVVDPNLKDTDVAEASAPQPVPQIVKAPAQEPAIDNGPAAGAPAESTFTHPPYEPTGPGDTAPAPPPPAPCYVDENGHDICP